jgi:DNA-binding MarR family transcriptional regulator
MFRLLSVERGAFARSGDRQYAVNMKDRQHTVKMKKDAPRSPAGDALSAVAIQVLRLGGLLTAAGDALSAPAGQTSARWQVLAGAEHAPSTVAQIARGLGLARQSIQRIADLLERDGLAVYEDNPEDQRARLLCLTPRGRSALVTIQRAQRFWADALGTEIGEAELRRASEVLERLTVALQAREA